MDKTVFESFEDYLEEANYPQGKKKSCRQQWISYQPGVTMGPQLFT
ncbi:hypothetical protein SMSK23_0660 [Streptococcus oralis ATCC 35037]|nr:hypothetical protein SMSK23_0660 [Streptococcus oralis ATCC 35037]